MMKKSRFNFYLNKGQDSEGRRRYIRNVKRGSKKKIHKRDKNTEDGQSYKNSRQNERRNTEKQMEQEWEIDR